MAPPFSHVLVERPRLHGRDRPRRGARVALVAALAGLLSACPAQQQGSSSVVAAAPIPDDRAPLEWARDEETFVVVRRSCRTVSVYRHGEWLRTYGSAAFGREPGDKLYEGDQRTPSGLYRIVGRKRHPRWSRFLLLDYPNLRDQLAHREAFDAGLAPSSAGGQVGIHGTDEPRFNELGVDWTLGCVSLMNDDVRELYDLVPDGTLVLIED